MLLNFIFGTSKNKQLVAGRSQKYTYGVWSTDYLIYRNHIAFSCSEHAVLASPALLSAILRKKKICCLSICLRPNFQFSYLQTNNNLEIDIIIERPGMPTAFVEIKSAAKISVSDLSSLFSLKRDYSKSHFFCLSNDITNKSIDGIEVLHWRKGLGELGFQAQK